MRPQEKKIACEDIDYAVLLCYAMLFDGTTYRQKKRRGEERREEKRREEERRGEKRREEKRREEISQGTIKSKDGDEIKTDIHSSLGSILLNLE